MYVFEFIASELIGNKPYKIFRFIFTLLAPYKLRKVCRKNVFHSKNTLNLQPCVSMLCDVQLYIFVILCNAFRMKVMKFNATEVPKNIYDENELFSSILTQKVIFFSIFGYLFGYFVTQVYFCLINWNLQQSISCLLQFTWIIINVKWRNKTYENQHFKEFHSLFYMICEYSVDLLLMC